MRGEIHMKMITKYAILLAVLALSIFFVAGCTSAPEGVAKAQEQEKGTMVDLSGAQESAIDTTSSTFNFVGYGPGKEHTGTFENFNGMLYVENGAIIGAKGTIDASSAKTDSAGVDKHLLNEDFFNVEMYPEMSFSSTSISNGMMTGELSFIGVTKTISFPVTVTENSLSADFLLDITDYQIKYAGMDKEVRILFDMKI